MAQYVEGIVAPVPKKNIAAYKKTAKMFGKFVMENGAVNYFELKGDNVPDGKTTSFPKAVKLKKDEVVFFSWVTFKSKADRNRIFKLMMKDPKFANMEMPFDGNRMIFGSFKSFYSVQS